MELDLSKETPSYTTASSREVVPPGRYRAKLLSAELKDNKKKTGKFILVDFFITEPGFEGADVRHFFNIVNENAKAVQISKSELAALGRCLASSAGVSGDAPIKKFLTMVGDAFPQWAGKEVILTLGVEKGKSYINVETGETKDGREQNTIKRFDPVDVFVKKTAASTPTSAPKVAAKTTPVKTTPAPVVEEVDEDFEEVVHIDTVVHGDVVGEEGEPEWDDDIPF